MTDLPIGRPGSRPAHSQVAPARLILPALVPLAIFMLWTIAANRHWMSEQVLPTPALVWTTAQDLSADNLWSNLLISLGRLGIGLVGGVAIGVGLGAAMGLSRRIETLLYTTLVALVQIPTLAWVPLLMLLLGLGEALKIVLIVKAVAIPVALQTHIGVRDLDPRLVDAARVLRLGTLARMRLLVLPSALAPFLTGVRQGLAQGWIALVAVELLASSEGIGFLMVWGRQLFQLDVVFVCMIVIGLVGLIMDLLLQWIEPRIIRWPSQTIARHRAGSSVGGGIWSALLPVLLILIWGVASVTGAIDPRLFPAPWTIVVALAHGIADATMPVALGGSLIRSALGLTIGGLSGLGVGLATGLLPPLRLSLSATLTALRLVAIFAWLPLITAWVGLGDGAKITFIAIACFFPMQLASERGVRALSPELIEAARTLRLKPLAKLRYLVLPGAAPSIFAGFRLSLIISWVAAFGADYFLSGNGIGTLMINAEQGFRTDIVVAAMILVALTAAAIGLVGQAVEARATRWRAA